MRPPRLLLITLGLLLALGGAFTLWMQSGRIQALEGERRSLQGRLGQAQEQQQATEGRLAEIDAERQSLSGRVADLQRQMEAAQGAVSELQRQQSEAAARHQSELEALNGQVAGLTQERDTLRAQLVTLQNAKSELESRLENLERRAKLPGGGRAHGGTGSGSRGATPTVRVGRPSSGVDLPMRQEDGTIELPPIIVPQYGPSGESDAAPASGGNGRVVEIYERYHFIVIDQGRAEGVGPGMRFDLYRDSRLLGTVNVKQVRDHLSACDIGPSSPPGAFRVGDLAVPRRE